MWRYPVGIKWRAAEGVVKKPKVGETVHGGAWNGASTLCIVKLNKSSLSSCNPRADWIRTSWILVHRCRFAFNSRTPQKLEIHKYAPAFLMSMWQVEVLSDEVSRWTDNCSCSLFWIMFRSLDCLSELWLRNLDHLKINQVCPPLLAQSCCGNCCAPRLGFQVDGWS